MQASGENLGGRLKVTKRLRTIGRVGRFCAEMVRGLAEHVGRGDANHPSLVYRVLEQGCLLALNGITAEDYYLYELWRPELCLREKRAFLGDHDNWRWRIAVNPERYHFLTEDKVVFKRLMKGIGVPVPELYGVVGPQGRAESGEPLQTEAEIRAWFEEGGLQDVFIKPVLGSRGVGVLSLGRRLGRSTWERLPTGTLGIVDLLQHFRSYPHLSTYLVEERLIPHPALERFSSRVLHTARVVTLLDGEVEFLMAELRIGLGLHAGDNVSLGNMAAAINIETGRLGPAFLAKGGNYAEFEVHPDNGELIVGTEVPDWEVALGIVRNAARNASFNGLLGWDVAFTAKGPLVIEANDMWDPQTQHTNRKGLLAGPLFDYLRKRGLLGNIGLGIGFRERPALRGETSERWNPVSST